MTHPAVKRMTRTYGDGETTYTSWGVAHGDKFYGFGDDKWSKELAERVAGRIVNNDGDGYSASSLAHFTETAAVSQNETTCQIVTDEDLAAERAALSPEDRAKLDALPSGGIETTFHNLTVTIAADPARAYELLCKALETLSSQVTMEYRTDDFTTSDTPNDYRCTSELWPSHINEEPTC